MYEAEYRNKLCTPEAAVRLIPAAGTLSMGMAVSEPPALLAALEQRIRAGTIGGQLDFVRGAQLSRGGKSILTASSTANKGRLSRIVPRIVGPATDPRSDVQYIVTEYGVANLRGKSLAQRTEALINIDHPDFRSELTLCAKELGCF